MKKAFSLIELSIVLLIIGIIIAGVTQGSRLIQQFRIQVARNLTKNSPVSSIKDLALWYETSMESSFDDAETEDASLVSTWYDINPQASSKINATGTSSGRPTFHEDVFNHLPALRFDGNNDSLSIADGSFIVGTDYMVFLVSQRRTALASYVLGGNTSNFSLGYYHGANQIYYSNNGVGILHDIPVYSKPDPTIITASLQGDFGLKMWVNGGLTPDDTYDSSGPLLTSWSYPSIGRMNNYYFTGDVAEIIIFTRYLKTEERQAVEEYLSKKYNITIS